MIGKTISHYTILEKLGEGGMGVVYKARDTNLDREVAIKFLPPHLSSNKEARKRFIQEAKSASAIDHNHICTIYEIGEADDGSTFIVMAYYDGETLRERIDRGGITPDEAVDIASQIAAGLAKAHGKDIVHRDLKPQNILITDEGEAKIIDFGLAKLAGRTKLTMDGSTLGTAAYMSPEQARGEEVDLRSDIFSLGTMLYEMLAGEPPFKGEHEAALLYGVVHEEHRPLSELGREFPEPLHAIVNRALEKDPDDRYQSALGFNEDIAELRGQTTGRSGIQARAVKSRPRRRVLLAGIVGAALIVTLVAVLWPRLKGPAQVEEVTLAVVDFSDLTSSGDSLLTAGMAGLLHVGLVENSPCRVMSPSHLKDIRRRLFDVTRGPIDESQALEVARKSGATILLYGQMGELDGQPYVAWQLVDTQTGESVAARREQGSQMAGLADAVLEGVLQVLAPRCGAAVSLPAQSVTELTTANPEAYEYYVASMLAFEQMSWGKAVELLENAVALDSTFALAYFEMARVHRTMSGLGPAREATESAWKWRSRLSIRDRMRLEAWRNLINVNFREADEVYRELHTRWPDDKEILRDLLMQMYYWHSHGEGVDVARQAITLYPDEARFVFYYQGMLSMLDRPEEALEVARDLVSRFPKNPNHWDELALRFTEAGFPDSAEVTYQRMLEIKPGVWAARAGIAFLPYFRGDLDSAINNFEQFTSLNTLSFILYEAGQYGRAVETIDELVGLRSTAADRYFLQRWLYELMIRVGRAEEVLAWTDLLAEEMAAGGEEMDNPQIEGMVRGMSLELRAQALVAMDSLAAGREAVSELVESASEFGNKPRLKSLRLTARIALKEGDAAAALEALDQIRQESVGKSELLHEYHELRAEAYRMSGRLDEAAAEHKGLLRIYGGHAVSHYHLGLIYLEMKRPQDAKREFAKFLEMWAGADEGLPKLEDARSRLAELTKTNL